MAALTHMVQAEQSYSWSYYKYSAGTANLPILEGRGRQAGFPGVAGSHKSGAVAFTWAHGPIRQNRSAGYSYMPPDSHEAESQLSSGYA